MKTVNINGCEIAVRSIDRIEEVNHDYNPFSSNEYYCYFNVVCNDGHIKMVSVPYVTEDGYFDVGNNVELSLEKDRQELIKLMRKA